MKIFDKNDAPIRYQNRTVRATGDVQSYDCTAAHYFREGTLEYLGYIIRTVRVGTSIRCYRVHDAGGTCFAEVSINLGPALDYFEPKGEAL